MDKNHEDAVLLLLKPYVDKLVENAFNVCVIAQQKEESMKAAVEKIVVDRLCKCTIFPDGKMNDGRQRYLLDPEGRQTISEAQPKKEKFWQEKFWRWATQNRGTTTIA